MEITFKLDSLEKANLIIQGLAELPAKLSIGLIQELQAQAQAQLNTQQQEKNTNGKSDEPPAE